MIENPAGDPAGLVLVGRPLPSRPRLGLQPTRCHVPSPAAGPPPTRSFAVLAPARERLVLPRLGRMGGAGCMEDCLPVPRRRLADNRFQRRREGDGRLSEPVLERACGMTTRSLQLAFPRHGGKREACPDGRQHRKSGRADGCRGKHHLASVHEVAPSPRLTEAVPRERSDR